MSSLRDRVQARVAAGGPEGAAAQGLLAEAERLRVAAEAEEQALAAAKAEKDAREAADAAEAERVAAAAAAMSAQEVADLQAARQVEAESAAEAAIAAHVAWLNSGGGMSVSGMGGLISTVPASAPAVEVPAPEVPVE